MRGLSFVGLLVGLGIAGMLVLNQLKPSPETGKTPPTEAIDKAKEAAKTVEQSTETADALKKVEQIEQNTQDLPED